jgi:uncharacterized protein
MSLDANKEVVRRFFGLISERKVDGLAALLHDEATWTFPYRPDQFPLAGTQDKRGAVELLRGFLGPFTEFRFTIDQMTAEDDRVVIEAHSAGIGARGVAYQNVYHLHIVLRDGKLHRIREMFDPYEVTGYLQKIA